MMVWTHREVLRMKLKFVLSKFCMPKNGNLALCVVHSSCGIEGVQQSKINRDRTLTAVLFFGYGERTTDQGHQT
jgi:hypothetical protein